MERREAVAAIRATDEQGRPVPIAVTYCTYDKRRGGGKIKTIKGVVSMGAMDMANGIIRFQYADIGKRAKAHVFPVHLPLILEINGQPVW